jgi:hypothetical protein
VGLESSLSSLRMMPVLWLADRWWRWWRC